MLKIKLEAEKEKGNLREETINILKADKEYLQNELAKKDVFIRSAFAEKKPLKKPGNFVIQNNNTYILWLTLTIYNTPGRVTS